MGGLGIPPAAHKYDDVGVAGFCASFIRGGSSHIGGMIAIKRGDTLTAYVRGPFVIGGTTLRVCLPIEQKTDLLRESGVDNVVGKDAYIVAAVGGRGYEKFEFIEPP